jgi:hypothetical protein
VAPPRPGELHAGIAILGLLIRQSDTVAGLGLRLRTEHPGGRWARNSVHTSVPALAEQGFILIARPGRERSLDLYEPTPAGIEHFNAWLRRSTTTLPADRDALRAKLKYLQAEDQLRAVIGDIVRQEALCAREGEAAVTRYTTARELGRLSATDERDWRGRVERALMVDEVKLWYERAKRLRRMREQLEHP